MKCWIEGPLEGIGIIKSKTPPSTTAKIWCLQGRYNKLRPNFCSKSVAGPFLEPRFQFVVSQQIALTVSKTPQSWTNYKCPDKVLISFTVTIITMIITPAVAVAKPVPFSSGGIDKKISVWNNNGQKINLVSFGIIIHQFSIPL